MQDSGILTSLRQRLSGRPDSEHNQAITRLVFVSVVFVYFFTDYFAAKVDDLALQYAHLLAYVSMPVTIAILVAIFLRPGASPIRRVFGMCHDVCAISLAMYFAEGAGSVVAVLYLWITIGNGFRFGVPYLYTCAFLCIAGFSVVYLSSDYWQQQGQLSLNILLAMIVVSPYVGSMLRSLHAARDALQKQASTDKLTGLLRRGQIEESIDALFNGDSTGHVILFCDLDRFKAINNLSPAAWPATLPETSC